MINKNFLKEKALEFQIELTDKQLEKFDIYADFLVEYNKNVNLTAITDPKEIVVKHFIDSLLLTKFVEIKDNMKIADIGTGAGFPGVVLKILNENIDLTLVDSLGKRVTFLEKLNVKLGFNDTECVKARAEELGRDDNYREHFDLVTARAVANLAILSEYCVPLVKVGGYFAPLKGGSILEEHEDCQKAIEKLGGEIISIKQYTLEEKNDRGILVSKKISQTSTLYPRICGKIKKTPLR